MSNLNDKQVYCPDCKHVDWAFTLHLLGAEGIELPQKCKGCWFYDPEDSAPLGLRINYEEKL